MQFSLDFQLVFYSGSSSSIHTFRHLKHQDRTIFRPRGRKTLIFHYFQDYFNFARNNANFHNDAQTCTNRCFQILKAENVYYKDQQRAKRGFFMKKTRFFWETAVRLHSHTIKSSQNLIPMANSVIFSDNCNQGRIWTTLPL